jgi:hypothetical protein
MNETKESAQEQMRGISDFLTEKARILSEASKRATQQAKRTPVKRMGARPFIYEFFRLARYGDEVDHLRTSSAVSCKRIDTDSKEWPLGNTGENGVVLAYEHLGVLRYCPESQRSLMERQLGRTLLAVYLDPAVTSVE